MGAWGAGHFQNDSALDWVGDLEDQEDMSSVLGTLAERGENYERGEGILAAAEVIAALNGHPAPGLPEEVQDWIVDKPAPGPDVTRATIEAIEWVRRSSELQELWGDSDSMAEWTSVVEELRLRLSQPVLERELVPRDLEKLRTKRKRREEEWLAKNPLNQQGAPGDMIGIPLKDGRWALGQILEYEPREGAYWATHGVGILFSRMLDADHQDPVEPAPLGEVVSCLRMCFDFLEAGKWRIFAREKPIDVAREAQAMAVRNERSHADPSSGGYLGAAVVEHLANAYHALEPWNMYPGGPDAYDECTYSPLIGSPRSASTGRRTRACGLRSRRVLVRTEKRQLRN